MLKHVEIESYQSLKHVSLDLAPLTVIVGESDKGKSAALRALAAWAFNEAGNSFIHHGDSFAAVTVELSEGNRVTWMKGKTGRYVIDEGTEGERVFTKLGQSVPEEVQDLIGIRELDIDGTKLTPQVSDQFDPPFLLRESAGRAAKVLARMTQLDVVMTAATECNRDLKRTRQQVTEIAGQAVVKNEQLDSFSNLDDLDDQLTEWEAAHQQLLVDEATAQAAQTHLRTLERIERDLAPFPLTAAQLDEAIADVNFALGCAQELQKHTTAASQAAAPAIATGHVGEALDSIDATLAIVRELRLLQRAVADGDTAHEDLETLSVTIARYEEEIEKYGPCPSCGQLMVAA